MHRGDRVPDQGRAAVPVHLLLNREQLARWLLHVHQPGPARLRRHAAGGVGGPWLRRRVLQLVVRGAGEARAGRGRGRGRQDVRGTLPLAAPLLPASAGRKRAHA